MMKRACLLNCSKRLSTGMEGKNMDLWWEIGATWRASSIRYHLFTKRKMYKITVRKGFRRRIYYNTGDSVTDALRIAVWESQQNI
jgi:hypothetical protein